NTRNQFDAERLQRYEGRILILLAAFRDEEAEGRVISEAIVQREVGAHAPRVLSIESQPANALRKAAVPAAYFLLKHKEIVGELVQVVHIEAGILGKLNQRFRVVRQPSRKHWLMNEIDSEFR